jgi:hypothetical protein
LPVLKEVPIGTDIAVAIAVLDGWMIIFPLPLLLRSKDYPTALELVFLVDEYGDFVLGGAYLDKCLSRTFSSLVRRQAQPGRRLRVFIPLPQVYWLKEEEAILEFALSGACYFKILPTFTYFSPQKCFGAYADGVLISDQFLCGLTGRRAPCENFADGRKLCGE